ncbi:Pecanex-like protein 1 [Paractinoplanes atraurantiacus]|uniref:Pecanex-like protein 1 n=1 Tax=Paractinoplanes atraurantiacus TaxID=1036182 RepID=A0A285IP33_9ACTN|nr:Pecanex-like protein 1 [Actinoplanes atraurantiacus]SNY49714.1 hypothetical protein SAMN05421748_11098 [Actinoplanes atraurantiacus]
MRRSKYRRAARSNNWFSGKRRIIAVAATLVAFGGIVTVTQVSNASTDRNQRKALSACDRIQAPPPAELSTKTRKGTYTTNNGRVTQHADDGAGDTVSVSTLRTRCRNWVMNNVGNNGQATTPPTTPATNEPAAGEPSASAPAEEGGNNGGEQGGDNGGQQGGDNGDQPDPQPTESQTTPPPGAGLGILTNSCDTSQLTPHDGFQNGNRCVSTEFGEVGEAANNPTLLITQAPRQVAPNTPFTLTVSTRNLIRDRFLAAGQGGYYVESSVLQNGLVRGHFHTACRMLENTNAAPAPDPVPAFFVATEDSRGSATPDSVQIQVPGLPTAGTAQCASWAGDGSHRIPMMQRANQIPAYDAVRITVRNGRGR